MNDILDANEARWQREADLSLTDDKRKLDSTIVLNKNTKFIYTRAKTCRRVYVNGIQCPFEQIILRSHPGDDGKKWR